MINLNKCKKTGVILVFLGVLLNPLVAQIEHEGDWFSASTVSSVVKLGSVLQIYEVEGLPDNYTYRTKGGEPDFGNAKVISSRTVFENYGSGVIISESGLIISNAHVARAYIRPTIETLSDSKSVKLVIVNPMPYLMFVGVSDKERVENGDDAQKLKYAAYVIDADENFDNNKRDRSVLQIVYSARLGNDGLPKIGEKLSNHLELHSWIKKFVQSDFQASVTRTVQHELLANYWDIKMKIVLLSCIQVISPVETVVAVFSTKII